MTNEFTIAVDSNADRWVPACGGTEKPTRTRTGARLLYCYNPFQHKHAYLNCDTDIILSDEEANNLLWPENQKYSRLGA